MKRVLHVSQPVSEGVANCVRDLVAHQVQRGWDVVVACPRDGWLTEADAGVGAVVVTWDASRQLGPNLLNEQRALKRIVADLEPDLLHLHSAKAGLIGRLVARGSRPTVYQPNGWSYLAVGGALRLATLAWETAACRWTDSTIVVSEGERWLAPRSSGQFVIVPNTVDLRQIDCAGVEVGLQISASGDVRGWSEELRRRWRRKEFDVGEEPVVVCVGRLCRQKGQDVLLDAWPHVLRRVPAAQLVLVGDGPDRTALESRAVPRVHFLGQRSDAVGLLHLADLVVLPSRWEGMSYAMLEAMAAARSVVACHAPGVWETVGAGAGAVVPIGDAIALADAISARLLDPARARDEGARAREIIEQRHQLSSALAAVEVVYRRVLGHGHLVLVR